MASKQFVQFIATSSIIIVFIAGVGLSEPNFIQDVPVKSLRDDLLPGLYQVAVTGLLEQSTFFSSWSIGLIAAGWYVMLHGMERKTHVYMSISFVLVCLAGLASLFLGQLLHQVVIRSIAIGQDPIFNPQSGQLISFQYWMTVTQGATVAIAVLWRFAND
ncbi:hypothetical protein [Rhizobium sp. Rhizsp82]|uniref:hypothetical protein n=1 Tax=Rhizobium sp. Rhizsp82 TaxID=3243057 RepID=UPI0039B36A2E